MKTLVQILIVSLYCLFFTCFTLIAQEKDMLQLSREELRKAVIVKVYEGWDLNEKLWQDWEKNFREAGKLDSFLEILMDLLTLNPKNLEKPSNYKVRINSYGSAQIEEKEVLIDVKSEDFRVCLLTVIGEILPKDSSHWERFLDAYSQEEADLTKMYMIRCLGKFAGEKGIKIIRKLDEKERGVISYATIEMYRYTQLPLDLKRIKHMFRQLRGEVKGAESALRTLKLIKNDRVLKGVMRELLNSDPYVRSYAVEILEAHKDPRTLKALIESFEKEKDESVIKKLIETLAVFEDERTVKPLIRKLPMIQDSFARSEIIATLGQIGGELAKAALMKLWKEEKDERVQKVIITSLGWLKDSELLTFFEEFLKDPDSKHYSWACNSISKIDTPESLQILKKWAVSNETPEDKLGDYVSALISMKKQDGAHTFLEIIRKMQDSRREKLIKAVSEYYFFPTEKKFRECFFALLLEQPLDADTKNSPFASGIEILEKQSKIPYSRQDRHGSIEKWRAFFKDK